MTDTTTEQPAPAGAAALLQPDAAPAAADAGAAPAPDAAAEAHWWQQDAFGISTDKPDSGGLSDSEWMANKKFATLPDMIRAARNLESTLGAQNRVSLPKGPEDKEGWATLAKALGVPEKAEGYALELAEGYDAGFVDSFRAKAHELGMAPHQVQALAQWFEGSTEQAANGNADAARAALEKQWGGEYRANLTHAQRGMERLQLAPDDLNAMAAGYGLDKVMQVMAKIGRGFAEDSGLPGGGTAAANGQNGPAWAANRKAEILADPTLGAKLIAGDPALKAEWARIADIDATELQRRRYG